MIVEKRERKPKSTRRCGWDVLSDISCALFVILFGAFLIFHLVIFYISGSVMVFEHSRSMAMFEGIALFAFIALALDRFRRLGERNKRTHADFDKELRRQNPSESEHSHSLHKDKPLF